MILFAEDYKNYSGCILDTETTNRSFVELAAKYRQMGIKNHGFILILLNPELQGVDPFDEDNLTVEQKTAIAIECRLNFWYFIRECARVPSTSGNRKIMFRATRGNVCLYWLFFNHITVFLEHLRQTGKSLGMYVLYSYLLNIRCTNTSINFLTKDDKLLVDSLSKLKGVIEELPSYLNMKKKTDIANTEQINISLLKNTIKGHLSNQSPKLAQKTGVGFTSPISHVDEFPIVPNIGIALPAILMTGNDARDQAELSGEPYGTILTGTSGEIDDRDGSYAYEFKQEMAQWTEFMFDCNNRKHLEEVVRKSSRSNMSSNNNETTVFSSKGILAVNAVFNHRQLGYSDEWLRKKIEDSRAKGDSADRDLFSVWTRKESKRNPLSKDLLDRIKSSRAEDFYSEISGTNAYITRWQIQANEIEWFMNNNDTILSLDPSDAVGRDDIGLNIRSVTTGSTIAAGNYNETNVYEFCRWLVDQIEKYQKMVCIIERNRNGATILDILIVMLLERNINPYRRLYNRIVNEFDKYPDRFREIDKPLYAIDRSVFIKYRDSFGFNTSGYGQTSRNDLYSTTLLNAATYTGDLVKDPKTIDQILNLEDTKGRVDHKYDEHDDLCIAWLLNYWFLTYARNLSYYGINTTKILTENTAVRKTQQEINSYDYIEQKNIRDQIDLNYEKLCKEKDGFIQMKLESILRQLSNKLILQSGEIFSLDSLLEEAKKNRGLAKINQNNYTLKGGNRYY